MLLIFFIYFFNLSLIWSVRSRGKREVRRQGKKWDVGEGMHMLSLHVCKSKSSILVSWLLKWRGLASGSLHGTLPIPVHVIHVRANACTGIIAGSFSPLVLFLLVPFPSGSMKDSSVQFYLEIIHQPGRQSKRATHPVASVIWFANVLPFKQRPCWSFNHQVQISARIMCIYLRTLVTADVNVGLRVPYK